MKKIFFWVDPVSTQVRDPKVNLGHDRVGPRAETYFGSRPHSAAIDNTKNEMFGQTLQFSAQDQNVNFLPKPENPPNTPEVCCIEEFWSFK